MDPSNPQTWNLYAYVMNNPVSASDPTGLDCIHINPDTGKYEGFDVGDCDNSTEELANSGQYVDGSVSTIYTTTGTDQGVVTGYSGTSDVGNLMHASFYTGSTSDSNPFGMPFGTGLLNRAANNGSGFTLGIRAPGQTYRQCLAANSGNYGIYNWLPSSLQNGGTKFALSNDVSNALFGDANEGTAGLLPDAAAAAAPLGVGTAGTFGRRTASLFDLNLSGTTGPAPTILGKTGAAEVVGWVSGAFELKLAADIGATGAEMLNCIGHR